MAKRGRKRTRKRYFDEEQEEAIIHYLEATCPDERNRIYEKSLKLPLYKMAESIINRFQYYSHKLTFKELMDDTLSDLHTKIEKFNPVRSAEERIRKIITDEFNEKYVGDFVNYMPEGAIKCTTKEIQEFIGTISGNLSKKCVSKLKTLTTTKAYSYFGTIIKHYVLGKRIKEQKEMERIASYETQVDYITQSEKYSYQMTPEDSTMKEFFYEYIEIIEKVLESNDEGDFLKPNEEKIGYAVVHLMKNWEGVFDDGGHKYQKNQVLECLRNMTNLTTKDIRDNLKRFKVLYYEEKQAKVDRDYQLKVDSATRKSNPDSKS